MKDSDIPEFTTKVLAACAQATRDGRWKGPKAAGEFNGHYCPLFCYSEYNNGMQAIPLDYGSSFMRGYDLRESHEYGDHRFYTLGQAFREIALTTGFSGF